MAYYKNGDKELAKKELKRALELDPKFSGAQDAKDTLATLK
jgi:Tfp pilus assembly protein PilF